ncbi:MAG: flagellar hook-length control protein FliK, partial [Rhizobiaceae bacterium]
EPPRRPAPAGQAVKVSVEQAPPPLPSTTAALSQAVAEAMSPGNAAPAAFVRDIPATHGQQPFKILKIELHPAELGAVTARLKAVGDGLSIEIEVETDEAYRRLSHDREAIGQQLRGLGYTVDSVTILQPAVTVNAGARPESTSFASGAKGGEGAPAGDGSGRSGSDTGGRKGGDGHGGQDRDTASGPARLRAGGGVYI